MITGSYAYSPTFTSQLLISNSSALLTKEEISKLQKQCKTIGKSNDIIEINLLSDIFDSSEMINKEKPTKFLSGYKLKIDTTIDNFSSIDASVAKSQQAFFNAYAELNPYTVIETILTKIKLSENLQEYLASINDNPSLYNTKNENWHQDAKIDVPEPTMKPVTRHFFNSPFYKAVTEQDSTKRKKVLIIDVFNTKGMALRNSRNIDEPHGNFVQAVLEQLLGEKDIDVERFSVRAIKEKPCSFNPKSLLKALKNINETNRPDYLNLSVFYPADYILKGQEFSPDDLYKLSSEIRETQPNYIKHILEEIERIVDLGCEVYIAGGNKGNKFNTLSLARGAHIIGGKDKSPLKVMSSNSIIEQYEPLPVYIRGTKKITSDNCTIKYTFERDLTKLSKAELRQRIAKTDDYDKLREHAIELSKNGKYKFDLNFLAYKFAFSFSKDVRGKIFDINKFIEIMKPYFDKDVLDNISPQGTHCDIQFVQFFDMNKKSHCVISKHKTTKVLKSISGTSFAAPQALARDVSHDLVARAFVQKNRKLAELVLKNIHY